MPWTGIAGYDDDGNPTKGDYALMFEEEYRRLANHPDYRTLFQEVDLTKAAEEVHNGYFSIDKKGGWTDTAENNQTNRDNAERAYNLIMREKERTPEPRDAAQVHLLPFGAARGVGQPQRLSDLRAP